MARCRLYGFFRFFFPYMYLKPCTKLELRGSVLKKRRKRGMRKTPTPITRCSVTIPIVRTHAASRGKTGDATEFLQCGYHLYI